MKKLLLGLVLALVGCRENNVPARVVMIERFVSIENGVHGAEITVVTSGKTLHYRTDNANPIVAANLQVGDKLWIDLQEGRIVSLGEKTTAVEGAETVE